MKIRLYLGFEKKKNSTQIPDNTVDYIDLDGTLKEDCSTLNPRVRILRTISDLVPDTYNYAYILAFGRYYFITDCVWSEPFWEISMAVDVLASWKTQIGLESHYVLRTNSSTNNFDPLITDTMYPTSNDYATVHNVMVNNNFAPTINGGCYIVGIISSETQNAVGAISYYAMSSTEFGTLKTTLFSNDNLYKMGIVDSSYQAIVTDMSPEILKTMYNPYQYIASCMWFPIAASDLGGTNQTGINIGWWPYSNLTGRRLYAQSKDYLNSEQTTVPTHPQASTRGTYLNYSPYTRITLSGRFGTIALDPSYLKPGYTINIGYYIDIISGQCRAHISAWDPDESLPVVIPLADRIFQIGVPIQIAQVGIDYLGSALTAVDAAGSAIDNLVHLNIGGAVSAAAHGIYNTLQASMPQVETSGANGSFLSPFSLTHIVFHYYKIVDEDINHRGRPLCQIRTLNTLTGYILCSDGEISVPCLDSEKEMISDYLTSGFFWE